MPDYEESRARVNELEALRARVVALETEKKELVAKADQESQARVKELELLESKVAALEAENKELKASKAKADAESVEYQELRTQVNDLDPLRARVAAVEAEKKELVAKADQESQARLKELESLESKIVRLEAVNKELKASKAKAVEQVAPQTGFPPRMISHSQHYLGVSFVAFGVLTVLASVIAGIAPLAGLGLASFLIGLLLVYLPSQPSVAPELVEASVISSLTNTERALRELAPETKALYLNVRDRLDVPMVLLPVSDNPSPPSEIGLSDEDRFLLVDSEDPHRSGLLFEAPGSSLLALMEKESGVDFFDLAREDLMDALRSGMVESLEVATDLKGELTESGMKLRIKDGALAGLSRSIARSAPNVSSRLGCPICSAAICAAVKTLKRQMILEEAAHQSGYHVVTLRFFGSPTNETD